MAGANTAPHGAASHPHPTIRRTLNSMYLVRRDLDDEGLGVLEHVWQREFDDGLSWCLLQTLLPGVVGDSPKRACTTGVVGCGVDGSTVEVREFPPCSRSDPTAWRCSERVGRACDPDMLARFGVWRVGPLCSQKKTRPFSVRYHSASDMPTRGATEGCFVHWLVVAYPCDTVRGVFDPDGFESPG